MGLLLRTGESFYLEYPFPFILVLRRLINPLNQGTEYLSPSLFAFVAKFSHFTLHNLHNGLTIQVGGCTISHVDAEQCFLS